MAVCTLHDFKPSVLNIYHTTRVKSDHARVLWSFAVVKLKELQRLRAASEDSACYNVTFPAVLFSEYGVS